MGLPTGYTQLQYVISGYETFLRLGTTFGYAGLTNVYVDGMTTDTSTNSAFYGGSDTTYGYDYYAGAYTTSGGSKIRVMDDDTDTTVSGWSHNVRHTFEFTTTAIYIDGVLKSKVTDRDNYGSLYILYTRPSPRYYFRGYVYEIKVAGHVFTPALRTSDNVAGFYCDTGTFYASGGDNPFTAGPVLVTSTIYNGSTLIPKVYYGETPIVAAYYQDYNFLGGGGGSVTPLEYDYILDGDYDEVDILYTADTHLRWLGNAGSDYAYSPVFSLQNIADYKDKLWDAGIPTFCLDSGDWVHGSTNTEALRDEIINFFNNCGTKGLTKYLSVTWGNHEWYAAVGDAATCKAYMDRIDNMSGCNLLLSGNTVYKPYRAIKVGNKKIGIITIGYPSPNGRDGTTSDVRSFGGYTFYDSTQTTGTSTSSALNTQAQKYIDMFKKRNFDYIICNTHMDKYADEDFSADTRFNSRADLLLQNTDGIDILIPGHYNIEINSTYTYTGTGGHKGTIVQEAGASCHSFGRIKLKFDGSGFTSYLLTSQSDLDNIG